MALLNNLPLKIYGETLLDGVTVRRELLPQPNGSTTHPSHSWPRSERPFSSEPYLSHLPTEKLNIDKAIADGTVRPIDNAFSCPEKDIGKAIYLVWTVFSRSTPPYQSARSIELKSGEVPNKVGYYIGYLINYGPYTSVDRVTTPAGVLVFELGRLTLAERRTLEAIAWNVGVVEPNGDFNCQNWLAALLSVAVARGLFAEDRVRVVIESALREDKPDTALAALLPQPVHAPAVFDDEEVVQTPAPVQQTLITRPTRPPCGQRQGWKPSTPEDFGDGGSFPECHVAQYPLEMGRKKGSSGNTLALQVDSEGNVRYDAIAHQGQRPDKRIQSQFKDLVPLLHRKDLEDKDRTMDRPSEDEVQATADKTRAALEKLVNGKIKAAQPKNVPDSQGKTSFIRYTPGQQNGEAGLKQRIIKMSEVVEDPLEPPRFKHKKIPRGPPSPPPPVLRSPPRKATAAEQKEWMIPPCISNWKNNKGFTIPLDKRLAADGRGLQDIHINDNFAKFSEALFVADRHAREEVRQRALMQQKLAHKEKEAKEENLRFLAQRAREERGGIAPKPSAASQAALQSSLAAYGSDSGSGSESEG
ncbi:hypothetical protein DXG03_000833 [Asterophora parasitica]|uniref:Pre-mRNA-processing protein 45 n=1 Tax=Asterophora parasitica TaxID=117018 RepID=A0A9P7KGY6_9AGAR|nr:hypothetical protein DXG03_000833 [Asterophora parasitica]